MSSDNITFYPPLEGDFLYDSFDLSDWLNSFEKYKKIIHQYVYATFLVVGTFSNIPCAVCMTKYCRTAWSVSFYLILSMLFELIELYIYCGNWWFLAVTNNNLTWKINILSNAVCKVYNFATNVLIYFLSWITVAMSIETMITVTNPQRMYKMCTVERARSVVLLIIVLVVSLNLHYFWTIGLSTPATDPDIRDPICHNNYQPQMSGDNSLVLPLTEFFLDCFFPFVLVTICVFISAVLLIRKKKDLSFELKKYIVDVDTLSQLQQPTVIMLVAFSVLKGLQCVEQIVRFIQMQTYDPNNQHYLFKEAYCLSLVNPTMKYFYISFKPVLFVAMCKQLRQDIIQGLCKIGRFCSQCGRSRYKSYISPESNKHMSRRLMPCDTRSNGDPVSNIKCTNV